MNLKTRPLLFAAGVGVAAHLLFRFLPQVFFNIVALPRLAAQSALSVAQWSWGIWLVACLCGAGLDLVIGALYPLIAARSEALAGIDGVIGGSATAALAHLVSGGLGLCAGLMLTPLLMQAQGRRLPGGVMFQVLVPQLLTGVGTLVLAVIIGLVAGAIGGAVLATFRGRNSDQLAGGGLL